MSDLCKLQTNNSAVFDFGDKKWILEVNFFLKKLIQKQLYFAKDSYRKYLQEIIQMPLNNFTSSLGDVW